MKCSVIPQYRGEPCNANTIRNVDPDVFLPCSYLDIFHTRKAYLINIRIWRNTPIYLEPLTGKNVNLTSMATEEPTTTEKPSRPRLGSRSHTQPTFSSPAKKTSSGLSSIDSQKKHKAHHHLPFFHTSNHEHHTLRTHLPLYKGKKGDESSKTNLRQHLQGGNPVEGLKSVVGDEQGGNDPSRRQSLKGQSPERPSGAQHVRLPNRPIRPEDVERERQRGKLRETYDDLTSALI